MNSFLFSTMLICIIPEIGYDLINRYVYSTTLCILNVIFDDFSMGRFVEDFCFNRIKSSAEVGMSGMGGKGRWGEWHITTLQKKRND
jgi:hypothetical protein